eukprot:Mrub_01182.p1 GENE.Mrub_01182~~Mrub_01182.p1  ORF type:complete len:783 (-),score=191.17 Mrub_01182:16-2175(-)
MKKGRIEIIQEHDMQNYVKEMVLKTLFTGENEVLRYDASFVKGFTPLFEGLTEFVMMIKTLYGSSKYTVELNNRINMNKHEVESNYVQIEKYEEYFNKYFTFKTNDLKKEMKNMFNDFEEKTYSKSDNLDNFMDNLNSRLQGIETGEKLTNYITKEELDKKIDDLKIKMNTQIDRMGQSQNKGSESQNIKIESQKLEQDKLNRKLHDRIEELTNLLNSKISQIDNLSNQFKKMDELTQKMESFDELSRDLTDKIQKNESESMAMKESFKKAESKMDQNSKTLKKLKTMAGIEDNDNSDPMTGSNSQGLFGNGSYNDKSRRESLASAAALEEMGMTPQDLKRLSQSMKNIDVGDFVTSKAFQKQYDDLLSMIKSQGEYVRNAFEGDVNPSSERLKNEIMKYIDDKLSNMPSQEMFDQYISEIKNEVEAKAMEEEKQKELNQNGLNSGFFSPDNIKNIIMKHNTAINQIEKTLKKMIYVEDDMCLKAQKIHCLSCGYSYGPKGEKDYARSLSNERSLSKERYDDSKLDSSRTLQSNYTKNYSNLKPNMRLENNLSVTSFTSENKGNYSTKNDYINDNDTSKMNAEEVHQSYKNFKRGFHYSKDHINNSKEINIDMNNITPHVDLNMDESIEIITNQNSKENKKEKNKNQQRDNDVDLDRPDTRESNHDDKYIRSKNLTTARNIKKIVDKNQNRIEAYKKDLVQRSSNVENNLIKSKYGGKK